jgi:hypothetical protein
LPWIKGVAHDPAHGSLTRITGGKHDPNLIDPDFGSFPRYGRDIHIKPSPGTSIRSYDLDSVIRENKALQRRDIITGDQSYFSRLQNIDPPSPFPPAESVLPPQQRRGYKLARRRGGWGGGVNILEVERNRIGLLVIISLRITVYHFSRLQTS